MKMLSYAPPHFRGLSILCGMGASLFSCQFLSLWMQYLTRYKPAMTLGNWFLWGRVLSKGFLVANIFPNTRVWQEASRTFFLAIACFAAFVVWRRTRKNLDCVFLGVSLGAATSTLVDLLRLGAVVDYWLLHVPSLGFAVAFNLPDILISMATLLLAFRLSCKKVVPSDDHTTSE